MRAPMIPGRRPEDDSQREAMLKRLGIAEDKPRPTSRWDLLARDMEPAAPVQTMLADEGEVVTQEALPVHQPIPMAEAAPAYEPVAEAPVVELPVRAPEPVVEVPVAEAHVEPVVHQPRWMDEPVAEAPPREELQRAVSYAEPSANDDDLSIPPAPQVEAAPVEPVMEQPAAPAPAARPVIRPRFDPSQFLRQPEPAPAPEPVVEAPVAYEPAPEPVVETPPAPVIEAPVAPERVIGAPVARAPEPVAEPEPPVVQMPAPQPEPVHEAPVVQRTPEPQPEPAAPAAPPVDAALQQMRAELEAMRKQFQTAPAAPEPAMPLAAAIPYDGRSRSKTKTDYFANARMVVWTLGIVVSLWFSWHALQASAQHQAREDHIMASMTGQEPADETAATAAPVEQQPAKPVRKRHKRRS